MALPGFQRGGVGDATPNDRRSAARADLGRAPAGGSAGLACFSLFGFLVYVPAVANLVHNYQLFLAKRLIDYAVVSLATLEQASKIPCQRLGRNFFKVFSQPTNSIQDAAGHWRVNPFQLPAGGFEDARSVHTTPALDAV